MDFDGEHEPCWFFEGAQRVQAREDLQTYSAHYAGAWFDRLASRSHPNRITADDIAAVSTLGVAVPGRKVAWLLGPGQEEITEVLQRIPADAAIWDERADLTPTGPAWQLWDLIRSTASSQPPGRSGMGNTKTSKLLAAKRPNLIPIQDSFLNKVLFRKKIDNYWVPWTNLHHSPEGEALRGEALAVRDEAGVGADLGPLRVIDIVIWMWAKRAS